MLLKRSLDKVQQKTELQLQRVNFSMLFLFCLNGPDSETAAQLNFRVALSTVLSGEVLVKPVNTILQSSGVQNVLNSG